MEFITFTITSKIPLFRRIYSVIKLNLLRSWMTMFHAMPQAYYVFVSVCLSSWWCCCIHLFILMLQSVEHTNLILQQRHPVNRPVVASQALGFYGMKPGSQILMKQRAFKFFMHTRYQQPETSDLAEYAICQLSVGILKVCVLIGNTIKNSHFL